MRSALRIFVLHASFFFLIFQVWMWRRWTKLDSVSVLVRCLLLGCGSCGSICLLWKPVLVFFCLFSVVCGDDVFFLLWVLFFWELVGCSCPRSGRMLCWPGSIRLKHFVFSHVPLQFSAARGQNTRNCRQRWRSCADDAKRFCFVDDVLWWMIESELVWSKRWRCLR